MFNKIIKFVSNNFYFCLFYLFISLCSVTILKEIPYINILPKLAILWGALLVAIHTVKILKRTPNLIELSIATFLIFTLAINLIFYRTKDNLTAWIINCIMLLGIFFINLNKNEKQLHNELNIFSNFISIFTFVFSIGTNILFFTKTSFTINNAIYGASIDARGFQGLYIYRNSLAIASGIGILVTYYLLLKNKNSTFKIKSFYFFNLISQILPLYYSDGRSGYFLIIAIPFVLVFMHFKNKYIRQAMILIPTIAGIVGFSLFHENLNTLSGRNELWYSAWLVIKNNPIFGVGNSALVESVYAARPGVVLPGIEAGGLHNIFLEILTANGAIALVLFLSIILISFSFLVKILDRSYGNMRKIDFVIFSLLVGLIFVNLFERNLLYIVSFMPIIFWTYLGYFISIKSNRNRL